MDRRSFMASASAFALGGTLPSCAIIDSGIAQPGQSLGEDARLKVMLNRFLYGRLEQNPQGATGLGLDVGDRAGLRNQIGDYSRAGEM